MSAAANLPELAALLSHPERIEAELCRRSLKRFVKAAWHIPEPAKPLVWGWHLDAICDHLEAVSRGEIRNLIVNIPPRFAKSLLVSVLWPVWTWTRNPEKRWLCASYAEPLAIRDSLKARRIIESSWFRKRWGDCFKLTGDQNAKSRFENDKTGYRIATSVGGKGTGEGGDFILVDDPTNVQQAISDAERETANVWWDETMSTRGNDPNTVARVIVMQRLHEDDLTGHVLAQGGYEHLCLPMEFEPERRCSTSIGFTDPRTEPDELLWPERFPREVVEDQKRRLGSYGAAAQFQQRPAPRGGGMFPVERLKIVAVLPEEPAWIVRYWDKAGSDSGDGAQTAGVKIGWLRKAQKFVVLHVVVGRWSALKREEIIRQTAEMDGKKVRIGIEQEPGSGGKESAESTIRNLAGFIVHADRPTGDKAVRAEPFAVQVEGANVMLLQGSWNPAYIDELRVFPAGKLRDQVDASSGAFNTLEPLTKRRSLEVWSS